MRGAVALAVGLASVGGLVLSTTASAADGTVESVTMRDAKGASVPAKSKLGGGGYAVVVGTGFPTGSKVWFGATQSAKVFQLSATTILAAVPAGSAGTVNVTVNDGSAAGTGLSTAADDFTYVAAPTVTNAAYSTTNVKHLVITGTGFTGATHVRFGHLSVALKPTNISTDGTTITVNAPSTLVNAKYTITVVSPYGDVSLSPDWNVRPVARKIQAATGTATIGNGTADGGNLVRITGTNLGSVDTVKFGTVTATNFLAANNNEIIVEVPAYSGTYDSTGLKAKVDVVVSNGTLASITKPKYEYRLLPAYTSKDVSTVVQTAATSTVVTITGTNLKNATVAFKTGTKVTSSVQTTADKAGSVGASTITFKAPASLPVGTHEVWIRTVTGVIRAGDYTITSS